VPVKIDVCLDLSHLDVEEVVTDGRRFYRWRISRPMWLG